MNIGNNWKIESDNLNVMLLKRIRRTKKDGTKYDDWITEGYFANPKNALHELINQKVRDTELKELKTIVQSIDELHKMIDGLPQTPLPNRLTAL